MHHNYIEEGNKMMRDTQLHLNPSMIEVACEKLGYNALILWVSSSNSSSI